MARSSSSIESTERLRSSILPDNLCVTPRGAILFCEDDATDADRDTARARAAASPNVNRLVGLTRGGRALHVRGERARTATEFAGACFSPDGTILFVNIFGDRTAGSGMTCAITGPWSDGPLCGRGTSPFSAAYRATTARSRNGRKPMVSLRVLPSFDSNHLYNQVMSSEHAALLKDSVTDFVARGTDIARVRALRGTRTNTTARSGAQMAELGWLGIAIPERYGGMGLGLTETAIVAEGLARALAPEPYTASAVLAAGALAACDNEALKRELLPRIVERRSLPALAWQELAGDARLRRTSRRARRRSKAASG